MKIVKSNISLDFVRHILAKPKELSSIELNLKIKDTLQKPLVRKVFHGDNAMLGFTFVTAIVKRFVDSFGFSTKLTPIQIEMITVDTLENFDYESVEDIILFFKMARSGKFGTTNRGIDSNLIYGEWFPKYLEIKAQSREQIYEKEKAGNSIHRRGSSKEEVMKRYSQDAEKSRLREVSSYIDRIVVNMDRQILEDTIIDWEKDPERKPYVGMLKKKRKSLK